METAGGTTNSADADEDTTEGVQTILVVGFGPTSLLIAGALRPSFASPTTLVFHFFYELRRIACIFFGGGVNGK